MYLHNEVYQNSISFLVKDKGGLGNGLHLPVSKFLSCLRLGFFRVLKHE